MEIQNAIPRAFVALLLSILWSSVLGQADPSQRRFKYYSIDAVNANYSSSGTTQLSIETTVDVGPFLYVYGDISANWTVQGWGTGTNSQTNTIRIYHNGTLTLQFSQFGNAKKQSGTNTGKQWIDVQSRLQLYNNATMASLFDSGLVESTHVNSLFSSSGPQFDCAATGGVLRLDFSRTISLTPDNGPGVYQNIGTITVSRN
jgi:hypothetical protein